MNMQELLIQRDTLLETLVRLEWIAVNPREGEFCYICGCGRTRLSDGPAGPYPFGEHAGGCDIDTALTKAGLLNQAARDALRERLPPL